MIDFEQALNDPSVSHQSTELARSVAEIAKQETADTIKRLDKQSLHEIGFHLQDDLRRLESFLVDEFPLALDQGDNLIHATIRIMKQQKRQLSFLNAGRAVFSEKTAENAKL